MRKTVSVIATVFLVVTIAVGVIYTMRSPENTTSKRTEHPNVDRTEQICLGVAVTDMTRELARQKRIRFSHGAYVDQLVYDPETNKRELQSGDIIKAVNHTAINTSDDLRNILNNELAGRKLQITVLRDEHELTFDMIASDTPCALTENQRKILYVLGLEAM